MSSIRVLIADDHPVVRQGLAAVLGAEEDIELVDEAASSEEAVEKTRELGPDVVVIDLSMPVMGGLAAIRQIALDRPEAHLLVLAGAATEEQVIAAIRAGATGFLLKGADADQLLGSIRSVHHGSLVVDPALSRRLLEQIGHPRQRPTATEALSARELDILRLVAQGLSNKEIARDLRLTTPTVMTHMRNILGKLRVSNRTQAALYARERGLA